MRKTLCRIVGGACLAAISFCPAFAANYRVKPVEIVDFSGFEKPVPVSTILIPHDWETQGGLTWDTQSGCGDGSGNIRWAAGDRSGRFGLQVFPAFGWQKTEMPAGLPGQSRCPNLGITSAREYLELLVREYRPGAKVLDYRPRPDLEKALPPLPQFPPLPDSRMDSARDMGEILIGYNYEGQDIREMVRAVVTVFTSTMSGAGMVFRTMTGTADPALAMRAPDGQLDFRFFDFVQKSVRVNPEWSRRMAEHRAAMNRINAKGAADRSAIVARTNREVNDIMAKGYENRQKSIDRSNENWLRGFRGVELYADPAGGERVELPNTYDNAWRLNDGSYVLAEDPSFDPSIAFGVDAQRLRQIK